MTDRKTCSTDAINAWAILIAGFTQREGQATPIEKLHRKTSKTLSGPDSVVVLRSWRDSTYDLAQRISNWRNGEPPKIVVIGYSYGGYSAVRLCRELQHLHLPVDRLYLIDPVARWLSKFPSIFSMFNILPITVPANVRNTKVWRQTSNYPRGARVRQEASSGDPTDMVNCGGQIEQTVFPYVPHENMDDLSQIKDAVYVGTCEVIL